MDLIFIGLAVACALLAGGRSPFLWLIAAEFAVSAAWINLPVGDPWWFLAYAGQNCVFVWLVMKVRHRLAREYAATLILSALLSTAVFCEFFVGASVVYAARPALMTWLCIYQLWLSAVGAGMAEGTIREAIHGVRYRSSGRLRRPRFDNPPRDVGGRL
ncbi:hypothetical protein [Microbulbifer celer]|uniref:Uncharacterized protein n=1 Tax=Microbulbifer celer TaxID=435905 RepID=A0ABW3UA86_9GAMM|nr:hypothetical protein [Microbulbifer celer]UFN58571.1 hypothetical protein LPW13_05880 [Microbulbifer celer]